jgi:hypothetical protein
VGGRAGAHAALALVRTEHDALIADAARLRDELRGQPADPQSALLQQAVERRLQDLLRTRARLEALLADDAVDPLESSR